MAETGIRLLRDEDISGWIWEVAAGVSLGAQRTKRNGCLEEERMAKAL